MGRSVIRCAVIVLVVAGLFAGQMARADLANPPVKLPISLRAGVPADSVVVEKGDHLWKISARHLDDRFQRKATDEEVGPYWRQVIQVNRESLRSGDPDLIYPGEVILLPSDSP